MTVPTSIPDSPSNTHLLISLTRVETKLDEHFRRIDNLETRMSKLESGRWPIPAVGALAGIGGAITAVIALLQH